MRTLVIVATLVNLAVACAEAPTAPPVVHAASCTPSYETVGLTLVAVSVSCDTTRGTITPPVP